MAPWLKGREFAGDGHRPHSQRRFTGDGEAGAALFSHDVRVVRQDFQSGVRTTLRLADLTSDPTRWPIIEGGFFEEGFLSANGRQRMVINYDFTDPAYIGPDPSEIVEVAFELILANDFRVQVWSDRQTGQSVVPNAPLTIAALDNENPALLEVAQASGNVKDGSNRQRVAFDYGLPTANQIAGFTIELTDVKGSTCTPSTTSTTASGSTPTPPASTTTRPFRPPPPAPKRGW